jgi:hypothetical protein
VATETGDPLSPAPDGGAPSALPVTGDDSPAFIAFQRDFQGFTAWPHFDVPDAPAAGGLIHPAGRRTVYINKMPAPGRTTFASGTVIVKVMENGDTLARVKRGGGYNMNGAPGWEWFELKQVDADWLIVWRGITPPAGFCYGGIVGGVCNTCHAAFAGNDFVGTAALLLRDFR